MSTDRTALRAQIGAANEAAYAALKLAIKAGLTGPAVDALRALARQSDVAFDAVVDALSAGGAK